MKDDALMPVHTNSDAYYTVEPIKCIAEGEGAGGGE